MGDPLEEYLADLTTRPQDGCSSELDAADPAGGARARRGDQVPAAELHGRAADWRHWVCALNATKSAVCLRFLWGVLLDDPLRVLRPGTSTLMTWDFPRGADVDTAAVASYVRDALAKRDHFLANDEEISAAARDTAADAISHRCSSGAT